MSKFVVNSSAKREQREQQELQIKQLMKIGYSRAKARREVKQKHREDIQRIVREMWEN